MLSRLVRILLALELGLYAAAGTWLHEHRGWTVAGVVIAAAVLSPGIRLVLVLLTVAVSRRTRGALAPSYPLSPPGWLRLVLGEWRAMLAFNYFHLPFEAWATRPDPETCERGRVPVVLVHGYCSNRGVLEPLVSALEKRGIAPVFTFSFDGIFVPIESLVPQLEAQVARALAATGAPKVVLVCHSMGGLTARAWLGRHGSARVAKLVTIASPHHGTALAPVGHGANAAQMRLGSPFLAGLASAEGDTGPGCPATSIYTAHDNQVTPQGSSALPWARNVLLSGMGHIDILRSRELHEVLLEELLHAGASGPGEAAAPVNEQRSGVAPR